MKALADVTAEYLGLPFGNRDALPWSFRGHTYGGGGARRRDDDDDARAVGSARAVVLQRAAAAAGAFAGAPCMRRTGDAGFPCHVPQTQ